MMKNNKKSMKRNIAEKLDTMLELFHFLPHRYYCSACGEKSILFFNVGVKAGIFHTKKILGGGYRKNVYCPKCGANDRFRWVDYVLKNYTNVYSGNVSILHIAPENIIERKIRNNVNAMYITGNICAGLADEIVDITCMPQFKNQSFDYIIINHVLEHVKNEKCALNEIYRILKTGGRFVFSVPIAVDENTFESNNSQFSPKERLKLYGQKDHWRLYGKDVKNHISQYGFKIQEYNVNDILNDTQIKNYRLLSGDRVYIGVKIVV
jgi:SAM-dependent methyltransferase